MINYLVALVIVVMLCGIIATLAIGWSRENQMEHTGYVRGTAKKWGRLSVLYALVLVILFVVFFTFLR